MSRQAGAYLLALATVAGMGAVWATEQASSSAAVVEASQAILALQGDPAFGEYLGGECVTCHRRGAASQGIPQIAGMPAEDFVVALVEYREGIRSNEVMRSRAARLSDEEIAALAAHFAEHAPQ